jgi:hypothetical protein
MRSLAIGQLARAEKTSEAQVSLNAFSRLAIRVPLSPITQVSGTKCWT